MVDSRKAKILGRREKIASALYPKTHLGKPRTAEEWFNRSLKSENNETPSDEDKKNRICHFALVGIMREVMGVQEIMAQPFVDKSEIKIMDNKISEIEAGLPIITDFCEVAAEVEKTMTDIFEETKRLVKRFKDSHEGIY